MYSASLRKTALVSSSVSGRIVVLGLLCSDSDMELLGKVLTLLGLEAE